MENNKEPIFSENFDNNGVYIDHNMKEQFIEIIKEIVDYIYEQ